MMFDHEFKMAVDLLYSLSSETQFFLFTILFFTIIFHATYNPKTAESSPAFLTTLGILGTFVGIAMGLRTFDPNNIEASVPSLIDGIKTAVWASAAGILCALTLKLREIEGFIRKRNRVPQKHTIGELIDAIRALEHTLNTKNTQAAFPIITPVPAPTETEESKPKKSKTQDQF